jgi:capsular exopolysaccharide synthesis family protein
MRRNSIAGGTHSESELTISSIAATLRERKQRIMLWTCALLCLVAIYCVWARPHYQSTSLIEVQRSSSDLLGVESLMSTSSTEMGDALNASLDLQTQVEILQSDTLALRVINDLKLENTRDFESHWSPVGAVLGLLSPRGETDPPSASLDQAPARRSHALKVFKAHLKVKPVAGTRLIEVSFTHSDPKVAANVVNSLTHALIDFGFTSRNAATNQTSQWLGGQLSDLKQQAQKLQEKVVALQRYTGIYSLGEDSQGRDQLYSSTLDQLQQATTALSTATSSRIMKGAVYDTISHGDPEMISALAGTALGSASSSVQNSLALLQTLRTQQATTAAQLAQDTSKFGSDYPKLADERSNLASVDRAVEEEIERIGERAKNDFEASRDAENKLQGIYAERKSEAEKLNDRAIEYGIAKQEADNSRELYEDLSKRLNEAGIIEGLRSSNIMVISPAMVSSKPSSPNPPLYLGGALLLGVFFGICAALYADMTDFTVRSFGVVETDLGTNFLAILPALPKGRQRRFPAAENKRSLGKGSAAPGDAIAILEGPTSGFAEAMRALQLSLCPYRGAPSPQVILVTSAVPREGKTTVAVNLATLLAQTGKRVLFVSADLRRPASRGLLGLTESSKAGFSNLLTEDAHMETTEVEGVPRLEMLLGGSPVLHPADLLGSARLGELVEQWRHRFDHIVFDGPAVLERVDALLLSHLADTTLLIAKYGYTSYTSLERANHMLLAAPDTKVGVVLNGADRSSESYREYYGYSGSTSY